MKQKKSEETEVKIKPKKIIDTEKKLTNEIIFPAYSEICLFYLYI